MCYNLGMKRGFLIAGLVLLGFAIYCGTLANRDYNDPVGIALLILWGVAAGFTLGSSFQGEKETTTKETNIEDAEYKVN
jgi:hypothetical protein